MQEGLAQVCLVTSCMTITRCKVDVSIPRKRRGDCSQHDKGLNKFYEQVMRCGLGLSLITITRAAT
jgi:protein pelota